MFGGSGSGMWHSAKAMGDAAPGACEGIVLCGSLLYKSPSYMRHPMSLRGSGRVCGRRGLVYGIGNPVVVLSAPSRGDVDKARPEAFVERGVNEDPFVEAAPGQPVALGACWGNGQYNASGGDWLVVLNVVYGGVCGA